MTTLKYIVEIDPTHQKDLEQWISRNDGTIRPWDLALGKYGWVNTNSVPSLLSNIREAVESACPRQTIPDHTHLNHQQLLDVATSFANRFSITDRRGLDDFDAGNVTEDIAHLFMPKEPGPNPATALEV